MFSVLSGHSDIYIYHYIRGYQLDATGLMSGLNFANLICQFVEISDTNLIDSRYGAVG